VFRLQSVRLLKTARRTGEEGGHFSTLRKATRGSENLARQRVKVKQYFISEYMYKSFSCTNRACGEEGWRVEQEGWVEVEVEVEVEVGVGERRNTGVRANTSS